MIVIEYNTILELFFDVDLFFWKSSPWNEQINNIYKCFLFAIWQLHCLEKNSMTVNAWTLLPVLDLLGKNDLCSNASVKVLYVRRVRPCAFPK